MTSEKRYRAHVTGPAQRDIAAVIRWSAREFGPIAAIRYEALMLQALHDIEGEPHRPGSRARGDLDADALTYHLSYSRERAGAVVGTVHRPRHVVVYRVVGDVVEVLRLIHDAQDLPRHLSEE